MPHISELPAGCEPIHLWNPFTGEWEAIAVPIEPARKPSSRRRAKRTGRPVNRDGLSAGSPWAESLDDTAYAPATGPAGWADTRTYIKPAAMRTHRKALPGPSFNPGNVTARR